MDNSPKTSNKGWASIIATIIMLVLTAYTDPAKLKDPALVGGAIVGIATGAGLLQAKDDNKD